ncbi:MAG TPA: acyltransferase, partial [Novosphingobium sp.]|nr:acyltransferase [Novosphingobium sp.]
MNAPLPRPALPEQQPGGTVAAGAPRLDQLTALRFLAAMGVLSSHLWPLAEEANPIQPLAQTLFTQGFVGVSFFFMLSGFILAHTYQRRLTSGAISRRKYLALRIARIAPVHWVLALPSGLAVLLSVGWGALPRVLTNWALLQSWVPDSKWYFSLVGPSWSLSDEAFFYTCFAGLAFLSGRRLLLLAGVMLLADMAMVVWLQGHGRAELMNGEQQTLTHWLVYILPVTRLVEFVCGMLLYRLPRLGCGRGMATAVEAGSVVVLLAAMVGMPALGIPEIWQKQLGLMPVMALLLWVFASGRGAISAWLAGSRWLVLLGDASFALYLLHQPMINQVIALRDAASAPMALLPAMAGVTVLAVALSVVFYKLVEIPLQRATRRWVDKVLPR